MSTSIHVNGHEYVDVDDWSMVMDENQVLRTRNGELIAELLELNRDMRKHVEQVSQDLLAIRALILDK